MKNILLILLLSLAFLSKGMAQIKGWVFSLPDSLPLAGATIKTQNGQTFTSNNRGEFTVAPGWGSLTISHLAYQSKVIKSDGNPFSIYLLPLINTLDEVSINTGYQTVPKERATGSFTLITQNKLAEQQGSNLLGRLEGLASGFSVDRKSNNAGMMIRGLSSINGPRSPLIVVDNFPYEGNLDNLNPNDVESISILKDAAAASIWGARAGNGVIVITTKKARFNSSLQVQAGAFIQTGDKPNPARLRGIGVSDFILSERFLFGNGFYMPVENAANKAPLSPVVELLIANRDGKISSADMEAAIADIARYDLAAQYRDLMYRNPISSQYNLSLSSGAEKISWNFAAAYDENKNALDARYKRLSVKSAQNFQLAKGLMLNTQFIYTRSQSLGGKTDLNELTAINGKLPPYTRLADDHGNALPVIKNYRLGYINSTATNGLLDWNYYPYTDYQFNKTQSNIADLVGSFNLSYVFDQGIFQGLSLNGYYQYQQQQTSGLTLQGLQSYGARNLINSYSQVTGTAVKRPVPLGDILSGSDNMLNLHQFRFQPSYNRRFGKHNISMLTGAELRSSEVHNSNSRSYGYNADLLKSVNVDYANTYPNFVTGSNSFIPNGESFALTANNFISFYANGAYTYHDKYTLSASARRDASNLFGLNTNDKWSPLWSVGLVWDITKESFFKSTAINILNLRASYGLTGNVNPNMSALTTIGYSSVSPYTQTAFANFVAYANPELRWEKSAMLNIGLDFGIFNKRLSGSLEYFNKKGTDLYGRAEIDHTTGIGSSIIKNTAAMIAGGFDLNINSQNLVGNFKWQSDFFLNFYRDQVTDYYLTTQQGSAYLNGNTSITGISGYPVYALFSYPWAGLNPANGNPRGLLNGIVSEDYASLTGTATTINNLVYEGPALPKFTLALGNNFEYGHFSLNFRLSAKLGYVFRRESINYSNLFSSRNGHIDFADRWQQSGDEQHTNVPSMVYPVNGNRDGFYAGSQATVSKGDHIRLQYINLSYLLKLRGNRSRDIRFYLSASNLGILWQADRNGIDPDYLLYPPATSYTIGFKSNL